MHGLPAVYLDTVTLDASAGFGVWGLGLGFGVWGLGIKSSKFKTHLNT
jgi:hypothetical protein